jgi:single-strand DNA-binding protein
MASFNRVILVGNLTRDVDLRYTPGGTPVTEVGLAVNDRRKSQSGEWVEETTFVDVTLWGRTAEVASEYLSKGAPILVEGRLKLDTWETDGQKRSKLRVVGERMQMLGGRSGGGGGRPPRGDFDESEYSQPASVPQGSADGGQSPGSSGPAGPSGPSDDDIPF